MPTPRRYATAIFGMAILTVLAVLGGCADRPSEPQVDGILLAPGGGGKPPKVDQADPPSAPQDTTLDVRVLGSNFDDGSTVEYTIDGVPQAQVRTNAVTFVNESELVSNVTIDLDALVDLYDVEVMTTRGKKGIGADKFAVVEKGSTGGPNQPHPEYAELEVSGGINTLERQPGERVKDDATRLQVRGEAGAFRATMDLTNTYNAAVDALNNNRFTDGNLIGPLRDTLCVTANVDAVGAGTLVEQLEDEVGDTWTGDTTGVRGFTLKVSLKNLGVESRSHLMTSSWNLPPEPFDRFSYRMYFRDKSLGGLSGGWGDPTIDLLFDNTVNGERQRGFRIYGGSIAITNRITGAGLSSGEWPDLVCKNQDIVDVTVYNQP